MIAKRKFILLLLLFLPLLTLAQDERELENFILDVMQTLADADSYHFEASSNMTQIYDYEADEADETIIINSVFVGDFSGEDYRMAQEFTGVGADEMEMSAVLERIFVDDTVYIQGNPTDETAINPLPEEAPSEWTVYEPYMGADASVNDLVLNSLFGSPPPTVLPVRVGTIDAITELERETLNDMDMRVFEVTLDGFAVALQNMAANTPGTLADNMTTLLQQNAALAQAEYDLTMTLWIGAEDEWLYQAALYSRAYLPHRDADPDGYIPFNQETITELTLVISDYDVPVEITAPQVTEPESE